MNPQLPSLTELNLLMPEIWLIIAMCAVILIPFVGRKNVVLLVGTAVVGLVLSLLAALASLDSHASFGPVFSGMLTVDHFSQFFKLLLIGFTLLVLGQWWAVSRQNTHLYDTPDFLCLLLGAVVGMALMASASNLLMIFIAIELASMPSYALSGFRKRERIGSEGSLKYVLFGAASSAIMLYGMSLLYGAAGTLSLSGVAEHAAVGGVSPLMAVGLAAMFVGLAFKLSAVPLHFWCPDVFQAAPIEVTTFLSVASKGAAICLMMRILHAFGVAAIGYGPDVDFSGFGVGIAILGGITATWGNLVALHQVNLKRLLAYSSIAHAGYMIMASSLLLVSNESAQDVAGAIFFYLLVYLFMNLGAFTVAAMVGQRTGTNELSDYTSLIRRSPVLAVLLTLFLLSLFGMPGLGGFMGKIFLMKLMANAGVFGFVLITVLLVNTLLSLYFYMRPVYYMILTADSENRPAVFPKGLGLTMLIVCAVALLWTGLRSDVAYEITHELSAMSVSDRSELSAQMDQVSVPHTSLIWVDESVRRVSQ